MASVWQHPYLAEGSIAEIQRDYTNTLANAYGNGASGNACHAPSGCTNTQYCPDAALGRVPCGYNGIVTNCPRNSMMDWWVTGHQNAIYAVNGGSLWPWLEDQTSSCGNNVGYGSCYEYQPRLLGCCATPQQTMGLPGLQLARAGAGYQIADAYGFDAQAATGANMGIGNYSRMQKQVPPRTLQEPCAGTWLR